MLWPKLKQKEKNLKMYKRFFGHEGGEFVTSSLAFQFNIFDFIVDGKCVSLFFLSYFCICHSLRVGQQFGGIKTANE